MNDQPRKSLESYVKPAQVLRLVRTLCAVTDPEQLLRDLDERIVNPHKGRQKKGSIGEALKKKWPGPTLFEKAERRRIGLLIKIRNLIAAEGITEN